MDATDVMDAAVQDTGGSKKQTIQRIAKVVVFLGIFCVMIYYLCDIFEYSNNYMSTRYEMYKELEPGTVDVVMIGTSGFDRSWIAAKGFEKYGITVYPLTTDAMPSYLAIDMIKEAFRYQNPKLVLIDMRMFKMYELEKNTPMSKIRARRFIDTLDFFSPNRFDAIRRTQKAISEADPNESAYDMSYLFSFIQYHSKWSEDDFDPLEEIGADPSPYLGLYLTRNSVKVKKLKKTDWNNKRMDLTKLAEDSLYEILDYCAEHNIELLFVDSPHYLPDSFVRKTNTICDILDSRGINWVSFAGKQYYNKDNNFERQNIGIDGDGYYTIQFNGMDLVFQTRDEVISYLTKHTFDRKVHFFDNAHLNFNGAVIFTRLLGDYLVNNYNLEDHSEDPRYYQWKDVYSKIKKRAKKLKKAVEKALTGNLTDEERKQMEKEERKLKDEE
ncbi:MAG: hypothetical protein IK071_04355 [Lachnospiraceae bacterium]|nr:hypothetical protein [Lachnospiraceae bacterium]